MPTSITAACPYLGLRSDPGTSFSFPVPENCCFHCRSPQSPLLEHQKTYCLTQSHLDCRVFTRQEGKPFPRDLRLKANGVFARQPTVRRLLTYFIAFLLLLLVGWVLFRFFFGNGVENLRLSVAQAVGTANAVATDSAVVQPTRTSLLVLMPAKITATLEVPHGAASSPGLGGTPGPNQPGAPATPSAPQGHALEVPILVGGQQLIIHHVREGEGLELLAALYNTTSQAIQEINVALQSPLWVDSAIVISPGVMSIDPAFPAFEVYQVSAAQVDIDKIASSLNVDAALMRYYNNCPESCSLQAGDWLVIPRLP